MSSRYTYSQLPSTAIRLLEVQPQQAGKLVSCKIYHATRDYEYKALSYVCGDQSKRLPIILNGLDFDVGQNLHEFLQLASQQFPHTPMWVDELCIHQSDPGERSKQVQQIGDTYQNAQYVIAWLGAAGYPGSLLFPEASKGENLLTRNKLNEHHALSAGYLSDPKEQLISRAIRDFFDLRYFTRLWIYQEFFIAKDVLLVRGKYQIYTSVLLPYLTNLMLFRPDPASERPVLSRGDLYGLRVSRGFRLLERYSHKVPTLGLDEILSPDLDGECTEWRDRIFGLLSFCSQRVYISVNYRDSSEDMMIRLLIACERSKMQKAVEVLVHMYRVYETYRVEFSWQGSELGQNHIQRYYSLLDTLPQASSLPESRKYKKRFRLKVGNSDSPTTITCGCCLQTLKGDWGTPTYLLCVKAGLTHAVFWNLEGEETKSEVNVLGDTELSTSTMMVKDLEQSTQRVHMGETNPKLRKPFLPSRGLFSRPGFN